MNLVSVFQCITLKSYPMRPNPLLVLSFFLSILSLSASEPVYYETFGGPQSSYSPADTYQGWSMSACVYSGPARVASFSSYVCTSAGSSGASYLYFPSLGYDRFVVSGLNTSSCSSVELSFHARQLDADSDIMQVSYSTDGGSTWLPVSFSASPTSSWQRLTSTVPLPVSPSWSLKIEREKSGGGMLFIDDLCLSSPDAPAVTVDAPRFSPEPGTYYAPFELTLSAPSSSSVIYYTLDGSLPTTASLRYTTPIPVSSDLRVRAVACAEGACSGVVTADYRIVSPDPVSPEPLSSVGTLLVCEDGNGWHAMTHTVSGGALGSERVYRSASGMVLTRSQCEGGRLFWEVDTVKGRLRLPSGSYLSASSTTVLKLYATVSGLPSNVKWNRNASGGWYATVDKTDRALLYSSSVFKLYAPSNIGAPGYARQAAVSVPAYLGFVRQVTPDRFGTLCLPYDVCEADLGGVELYAVAGKETDDSGRAVSIVLDGPLRSASAGVPYLFRSSSGTVVFRYSGTEVLLPASRNGLIGSLTGINVSASASDATLSGYFVLSGNTFRLCAPGSSLGAERAYLDLDAVPVLSSSVKGLRLPLSDPSTPVSVPHSETSEVSPVYTLRGVRVGSGTDFGSAFLGLPSGLYLYRGGKYLVP